MHRLHCVRSPHASYVPTQVDCQFVLCHYNADIYSGMTNSCRVRFQPIGRNVGSVDYSRATRRRPVSLHSAKRAPAGHWMLGRINTCLMAMYRLT